MSFPLRNEFKSEGSSVFQIEPQLKDIENYLRWVKVENSDQVDVKSDSMIWWPSLLLESPIALLKAMPRNGTRANKARASIFLTRSKLLSEIFMIIQMSLRSFTQTMSYGKKLTTGQSIN
jgi:hypothetical protein